MTQAVLEVRGIVKHFQTRGGAIARAVNGVSFDLAKGETLGLIGESGCGKSTLARVLARLDTPDTGEVLLDGNDIGRIGNRAMKPIRRRIQMIFQDAVSSLNPRATAGAAVAEPLKLHRVVPRNKVKDRVAELFEAVGLPVGLMSRYPHEMSGGQCQRLSIARAISLDPDIIIADEAVSALDVSIKAQVINLLMDVQTRLGLSYVFITHDMALVGVLSHRIAVMYLGRFVEVGDADAIIRRPMHPYSQALIAASPIPDPDRPRTQALPIKGELPSPIKPPSGCTFHPRCPLAQARCKSEVPELRTTGEARQVACHFA
ncbi:ABC transporter ATP-binding protein [Aminobacter aganoensis]|uniref:Oligopeptide/dipeptide ABC transporter ATP-binding protein n=1 Tax=Aminobacter aganoensis TaxID=83264 RepID=A0A7X0FCJ7_9HYPH|nr:oligopeptide/dipeptide ABC transporter ATP-binding protein [Aminobacter aganoensis]MBB6357249.1 oligopeptide/dipeptide ABC transporter ATP-binding protein [Aminobacter aganoensis]